MVAYSLIESAGCNMPFTTLTDEDEKEFYRLNQFYWKEALRCEKSNYSRS